MDFKQSQDLIYSITQFLSRATAHVDKLKTSLALPNEDPLIADLFRGLIVSSGQDTQSVQQRLLEQTTEKLALGLVCLAALEKHQPKSVFVESGSTPALAMLALSRLAAAKRLLNVDMKTNNLLVQTALNSMCEPRLLYSDQPLVSKYCGYFPVTQAEFDEVFEGSKPAVNHALNVYPQIRDDAATYDILYLTCSAFHFELGPYVGSRENAFLKSAFYSMGRNIQVLIDGTKLLLTDEMLANEQADSGTCIRVFDMDSGICDRNPCVKLQLAGASLLTSSGPVLVPTSWEQAIASEDVTTQRSVVLHVAEPDWEELESAGDAPKWAIRIGQCLGVDPDAPIKNWKSSFRNRMTEAVRAANNRFSRVKLSLWSRDLKVFVDPRNHELHLSPPVNNDEVDEAMDSPVDRIRPVRLWSFEYQMK